MKSAYFSLLIFPLASLAVPTVAPVVFQLEATSDDATYNNKFVQMQENAKNPVDIAGQTQLSMASFLIAGEKNNANLFYIDSKMRLNAIMGNFAFTGQVTNLTSDPAYDFDLRRDNGANGDGYEGRTFPACQIASSTNQLQCNSKGNTQFYVTYIGNNQSAVSFHTVGLNKKSGVPIKLFARGAL